MSNLDLSALEGQLGYTFQDKSLLVRALTHRSYTATHNERLEFVGDSVLNCVIGFDLFKRDRDFTEGVLSRVRANLVCEDMLVVLARDMNLGHYLRMSEGELRSGGQDRPAILADALEAIFGAVFIEAGFDEAKRVVEHVYRNVLRELTPQQLSKDPKTLLQEFLQKKHHPLPQYRIVQELGPVHDRVFVCECVLSTLNITTTGQAKSRRAGEQLAAQQALAILAERGVMK